MPPREDNQYRQAAAVCYRRTPKGPVFLLVRTFDGKWTFPKGQIDFGMTESEAAENEAYITRVFEQLKKDEPSGLRYASFKLDDGVSFVHIVSLEAADGSNPLGQLPAFQAFTAQIKDRCEEPPLAVDLTEVGSYRFFGE